MSDAHDVIVIGSGVGGGTLVHNLAASGKRIPLFERWRLAHPRAQTERIDVRRPESELAHVA
jgi:choline dehydrogenase-like flavoprotein